jgi:hypothetical protein
VVQDVSQISNMNWSEFTIRFWRKILQTWRAVSIKTNGLMVIWPYCR